MAADTKGEEFSSTATASAAAEVAAIARAGEPDRYIAALLAPAPEREGLIALAALATELARVPLRVVREPIMGEIRLEWWRKALGGGEDRGHSVAEAVREAAQRYRLPAGLLDAMIDARAVELAPAPFADDAALDDFLWCTEGALFTLAARVMAGDMRGDGEEEACRAAGRAYGLARLLLGLPRSLSLGRVPLAMTQVASAGLSAHELLAGGDVRGGEHLLQAYIAQIRSSLAEARRCVRRLPQRTRVAFLPLALVGPYVRRLERQGGRALREEVGILPLARVWCIATGHVLGL